ncbi:hypothetical protein D5R40_30880 [Okeania hirsuta]|uniref:Uncharacterized protein n=1 Tax=Okeania hirsuta TaxID=1458930 RepID=A0A3N6QYS7_9CYAN|nr:hypothetical protein [Okeania hirsuta]RQH22475.1 hypothetical protein D5R40_30880 [Okeania hirsuta]
MAEELFPEGSAVGQKLQHGDTENDYHEVVGVGEDFRYRGGIMESGYGFFLRKNENRLLSSLLLKVNEDADAAFEAKLMKNMHQIAPDYSWKSNMLIEMRSNFLLVSFIPLLILELSELPHL